MFLMLLLLFVNPSLSLCLQVHSLNEAFTRMRVARVYYIMYRGIRPCPQCDVADMARC